MKLPFREGEREVPDHIGLWMSGLETFRMSFEEALAAMNRKLEADYINRKAAAMISAHFREHR